ncbi:tyrosine-type recombinase/integrase [Lysinibacillus fusiformis]|uniref:tyrosine-type recombinase/integrase n=1 Tax=Lysinibacillus fusiformis TaxID=28031 RepID=UPI0035C11DE5|nr:tyrosine-type recombinase/integrase [Lysinibacillus fusiformis]
MVLRQKRSYEAASQVELDLKITPIITAHALRHTHASILLYKGISLLYVSERLGHVSLDITTYTYTHLIKELLEKDSKQNLILNAKHAIFEHLNDPAVPIEIIYKNIGGNKKK